MPIVHNPESEWAKEARKWEALPSVFGSGERPYLKREFPTWMFLWGALPGGGTGVIDVQQAESESQRDTFESRNFRMEPLQAKAAFDAQQREYATLSAEREWDKRHRLTPKAVAEVEEVENAAGSEHLATIAAQPKRLVGRPPMDVEERARRSKET